jgi:hypothetical protein
MASQDGEHCVCCDLTSHACAWPTQPQADHTLARKHTLACARARARARPRAHTHKHTHTHTHTHQPKSLAGLRAQMYEPTEPIWARDGTE